MSTCSGNFPGFSRLNSSDDNRVACIGAAGIGSTCTRDTCARNTCAKDTCARDTCAKDTYARDTDAGNTFFAGDAYVKGFCAVERSKVYQLS